MNPMLTHHVIYTIPLGGGTSATDLSRSSPASLPADMTPNLAISVLPTPRSVGRHPSAVGNNRTFGPSNTEAHSLSSLTSLERQAVLVGRSEEHTSELQSLMRISYAVFRLKQHKNKLL